MTPGTDAPDHVYRAWQRYQAAMTCCEAGRCRYEAVPGSEGGPRLVTRDDDHERCDGYRGSLSIEHGQYVVRSTICDRHRSWWNRRRDWLRGQRSTTKKDGSGKKGWAEA